MTFSFNHPWLLLLMPAAAAFVIITSRNKIRVAGFRRNTALALRLILFVLLVLALSGFGLKKVSDSATTIFLVDSSDSTFRSKSTAEEFIKTAFKSRKSSDKVGVVNFGASAAVEFMPTATPSFTSLQTRIKSGFTDIEQGLKLSASMIPSGDRKRIVLLTDGLENTGDALKQARLLRHQNIILDVYPLESHQGKEVQVKEVSVPELLHLNEKFEVVVKVESTVKTQGVLKLYSDRQLAAERNVEIREGENNFVFSDIARNSGMAAYSAVIEAVDDTSTRNNKMSTFSYVEGAARVLAIQDADEGASELLKMLDGGIQVTAVKPENVPAAIEELQRYDAFIISNVSAEKLDDRFLNNLEVCIRHQGKGLLVTGGENSYAPGGYYKTVLEKVLPVNMDIKPKEEYPNLGLVLVIDKSGSMSQGQYGISKVELAKEAAIRSVEVLNKNDMIGVIAFDDAVQWVVKTQKPDDADAVQDAIGTIRAGGGTQILHPLEEAYLSLKDANAKLKHIILLTDGQAEKTGYEPLIKKINEAGITLSTVAVGQSADIRLLEALAAGGGGRFYLTDAFSDIPKIFVKETFLAGKTYLNNRTFTPNLGSYSDILKNIKTIPDLDGYVATTAKSTARVVFSSDRDEPILATWQYGLGRTAAWTSDAKGMWTQSWLEWEQSPQFWKNIVSWLMQRRVQGDYTIKGGLAAGAGTIELTLRPDGGSQGEKVEAMIISHSGSEQSITLDPSSPGIYKGTFDADEAGVYIANISIKNSGEVTRSINGGMVIPYSPEYDISRKDADAFIQKLAYEGGGRVLKSSSEVFSGELAPVISIIDMTSTLLIIIIILLMLDITVRRLNIPLEKAQALAAGALRSARRFASDALDPVVQNIRTRKQNIGGKEPTAEKVASAQNRPVPSQAPEAKRPHPDNSHISVLLEKKRKRDG